MLEHSFLIGDKSSDIKAAKAAGQQTEENLRKSCEASIGAEQQTE